MDILQLHQTIQPAEKITKEHHQDHPHQNHHNQSNQTNLSCHRFWYAKQKLMTRTPKLAKIGQNVKPEIFFFVLD